MDIAKFNADWLRAWSEKDVDALVGRYYAPNVVYKDPQTAAGLSGSDALRASLTGLFKAIPPTRYEPETVWPHADGSGYSGRWLGTTRRPDGTTRRTRWFELSLPGA